MSTVKANTYQDASGGNTATINSMTPTADSLQGFRNRIINGAMVIDQRNAGASVSNGVGAVYSLDRWLMAGFVASKFTVQQNAGSVTPPSGYSNYLGVTSSSAYSVPSGEYYSVNQYIEGFNTYDLAWGTANAKTVTLSFWVRSSLTGTFGGAFRNSADTRSYPFTYTISSANTWEQKTVTVAGDTSGTWVGATNGIGIRVVFSLGAGSTYSGTAGAWSGSFFNSATGAVSVVGTNGATLYITGVQLEVGSTATPFERRPYGTELMLCQRYYFKTFNQTTAPAQNAGLNTGEWCIPRVATGAITLRQSLSLPVVMRIAPSVITFFNPQAANAQARDADAGADCNSTTSLAFAQGDSKVTLYTITAAGGTIGNAIIVHITASAEL